MSFLYDKALWLVSAAPETVSRVEQAGLELLASAWLRLLVPQEIEWNSSFQTEKTEVKHNPHYRPLEEIVRGAIENYNQSHFHTRDLAFWNENPERITLEKLRLFLQQPLEAQDYDDLEEEFISEEFPPSNRIAHHKYNRKSFANIIGDRAALSRGEIRWEHCLSLLSWSPNCADLFQACCMMYMGSSGMEILAAHDDNTHSPQLQEVDVPRFVKRIEEYVIRFQHPISMQEILGWLLEETKGDVGLSFKYLTALMKILARRWEPVAVDTADNKQIYRAEWIAHHILDEFSPVLPYHELPQQVKLEQPILVNGRGSLYSKLHKLIIGQDVEGETINYDPRLNKVNATGVVYHAANLLDLLVNADPEFILLALVQEYSRYGIQHGELKALADIFLQKNLRKTRDYLRTLGSK